MAEVRYRGTAASMMGVAGLILLGACAGPPAPDQRAFEEHPAAEIAFTASGDIGTTPEAAATLAQIPALDAEFHIALGDLSYGDPGDEPAWCEFVAGHVGAGFPVQLIAGNHESDGLDGHIDAFAECLPERLPGMVGEYARRYYVDVPAGAPLARLVMISPGITFDDGSWSYADGSERSAWTRRAIEGARTSGIPWVIVGMHKPCLSVGNYECDPGPEIADLLVSAGADLVISGHEHLYQRTAQLGHGPRCDSIAPDEIAVDCIVDDGDHLEQGAGTVFVTVGTGGTALRDVHSGDREAGYFVAWSGANAEPSWGNLRVGLSRSALVVDFVPAVGAFTDEFGIAAADMPSEPVDR
ncbi:metallophosphoesterase [Agromyces kandeliae]|uniref:metallophosphoesterase n=1 Tax=Agromyces kandeliae TaxID=2666141 RepID=UPI0018A21E78|nr:metallophosphoesterase [Agromyces kandeliae]